MERGDRFFGHVVRDCSNTEYGRAFSFECGGRVVDVVIPWGQYFDLVERGCVEEYVSERIYQGLSHAED